MNRLEVIQAIIDCKRVKTYLEIGVEGGDVFLKVKAKKKIAVDPKILITKKSRFKSILKDFSNISNKYYQMTSDYFFETKASLFKNGLDVVFIDGLHTYEQSLRDIQNSLKLLNEDGVIIMHDCNPQTESIAYPAASCQHAEGLQLDGWTGEWSGDVWKTIAYLRSTHKNLHVFVLDCDYGLGIITKGTPENMLEFSKEEIKKLSYDDLAKNRSNILNLKNTEYFKEMIKALKGS
ncbi:class I SAM-dependent methyltransferase [Thermodesulfobacteriota bacterium]